MIDLLRGSGADADPGARPESFRRMPRRSTGLVRVGAGAVAAGAAAVLVLRSTAPAIAPATPPNVPRPRAEATASPPPGGRTYAITLADLAGLAPDARPGTRLQVWVTWDRPVTRRPRLQRLLEATVVAIAPPVVPDAPPTVLLGVAPSDVARLLWADRYGALSVVSLPG